MAKPTQFTCTLGQAAELNRDHEPISNINDFVDHLADTQPHAPAITFPWRTSNGEEWDLEVFSFEDVRRGSHYFASHVIDDFSNTELRLQTVALLCPSTPLFLFAWLGLIRAGHAVLLLAPQCQPAAIAHLMKTCDVDVLFHDEVYKQQAEEAVSLIDSDRAPGLPKARTVELGSDNRRMIASFTRWQPNVETPDRGTDVAYLHHTSGTSTGLPKPIPQTHRAAIGILPQVLDESQRATFTTTPLYHGGVADLFRAWSSRAMIGMFRGKGMPITATNVVACLDVFSSNTSQELPPICYFASVPYVLQMMAADEQGLRHLQDMQIVGVGGAALPAEIGDDLVAKGVNLISRFGSAECGFLLSSHRVYESDSDWQYLRAPADSEYLRFETREDGTSELVVLNKWPHRAKTNRQDGSYATSDLFVPHPTIEGAWRYHSRADSQLTLITGKKFDPAPLESAIATSSLLDDVLIFGNGRPYPGALLFRSAKSQDLSDDELISALSSAIEKLNAESQDHARLARNMVVVLPPGSSKLEKSSKGTILRNKAEETYDEEIAHAYEGVTAGVDGSTPDDELAALLAKHIKSISGRGDSLNIDTDLFSYGVDSVASIQIRYLVQQLLPETSKQVPLSVVEDCGTVERLADFIIKKRHGKSMDQEDELSLMHNLVNDYSKLRGPQTNGVQLDHAQVDGTAANGIVDGALKPSDKEVILLTGATGALGAHLVHQYRHNPHVSHIHLLVRGADDRAAHERVNKSLTSRGLPGLSPSPKDANSSRQAAINIHRAQLSHPHLGLSASVYHEIQQQITQITHAAWSVNFRMRLRSFEKDHIAGLRHLLDLSLSGPRSEKPKLAFVSSVASVASRHADASLGAIAETPSAEPKDASPLGYSRSKWVAEGILSSLHNNQDSRALHGRLSVFRVGQLAGDTQYGIWNSSEAWPILLASNKVTGVLPDLGTGEKLGWLGVDVAARAIVEATLPHTRDGNLASSDACARAGEGSEMPVYHILNDASPAASWSDLVVWVRKLVPDVRIVTPTEWLESLEKLQMTKPEHPALKLLGLWKAAYGGDSEAGAKGEDGEGENETTAKEEIGSSAAAAGFDTSVARQVAPCLRDVRAVDEAYFEKLWEWVQKNV